MCNADCSACGKPVTKRKGAGLCEACYMRQYRKGTTERTVGAPSEFCLHCGEHTGGKRYCDARCTARAQRGSPARIECAGCHSVFTPYGCRNTCSDECERIKKKRQSSARHARRMLTDAAYADKHRTASHMKRAKAAGVIAELVEFSEVMERGGWICHICDGEIDRTAAAYTPNAATVDHVVPLSAGGWHIYANCRPAHHLCNMRKGGKTEGDALTHNGLSLLPYQWAERLKIPLAVIMRRLTAGKSVDECLSRHIYRRSAIIGVYSDDPHLPCPLPLYRNPARTTAYLTKHAEQFAGFDWTAYHARQALPVEVTA